MCGRYDLATTSKALAAHFQLLFEPTFSPRYNIAPTQVLPVVRSDGSRARQCVAMRWGLIPSWAKDAGIGNKMINARGESLSQKPAFRTLVKSRRCLVPATGFFEWKKTGKIKQPYRIHPSNEGLFAFAGLWDSWRDANNQVIESFTIITGRPNSLVQPIHDRMPAIIAPDQYERWLTGELDSDGLAAVLDPFPADQLQADRVGRCVNSPSHDSPECLKPTDEPADEVRQSLFE